MNDLIKKQLFGSLGIESAEVDLSDVTEEDLPENDEDESSVAEAIEDVDLETEVEDIDEQGDDLEDASENLEELDVAVESFRNAGGKFTPIEALALTMAISQATSRFVKDTSSLVPAVESFKNNAEESTRLAHESLKETAKTFGDSVVEFAKKALARLKEIFADFINRFRGIESRANKVIVAAKAIKGQIEGEVDFPKDKISVGGKTDFETLKGSFESLVGSVVKLKEPTAVLKLLELMEELNKGEGKITVEQIFEAQNKYLDTSFREIYDNATESGTNLVSTFFPGEYQASLVRGETGATSLSYESFGRNKPEGKSEDVKLVAIQPNEIIALATAIKVLQKELAKYKGFFPRLDETMKRLNMVHVQDVDRLEKASDVKKNDKVRAKKIGDAAWKALTKQITFYSKLVSGSNDISGNILTLCEKSVALSKGDAGADSTKDEQVKTETPKEEGAEKTA